MDTSGATVDQAGDAVFDKSDIGELQFHLHASLLAAGLLAGGARKDAHQVGAKLGKDCFDGPAEAGSIRHQQDHRGNAPGHTDHGDQRAPAIVKHGFVGLREQVA